MASGWWKSSHTNLGLGSPIDFTVTTGPAAPRGYPQLASIATGAGLFLGGTPSVVIDGVIYYAGDGYVQSTDRPMVMRYDGRIGSEVFKIPYITGTTPVKAILSLATDDDGNIFASTWNSGTTSSDFAGGVYKYEASSGTVITMNTTSFVSGKLPYALAWFNDALYVGVNKQNPTTTTEVLKLSVTAVPGGPTPTPVLTGTTYTYKVGAYPNPFPSVASPTGKSANISCLNRATLTGTYYNRLTMDTPGGTAYFRINRVAGMTAGEIYSVVVPFSTIDDTGFGALSQDFIAGTQNITLTVVPFPAQSTTCSYKVGAVIGATEYISDVGSVANCPATLLSDLYVAVAWAAVPGASSYNVYRTAGHSSTGLIGTTTSTSLNDTGLTGTGAIPTISTSIALTAGAVSSLVVYGTSLYVGSYQPSATFARVYAISTSDVLSTSNTIAPGGTAGAYNGFPSGIVFDGNLYMAYWNDDATDIALIRKYNGSAWSTVKTISGAGARPIICFAEVDGKLWAYGGGDGVTGILYQSSTDGATWTDQSALLPSSKEAIPFIGNANVLGGF